MLTTEHIIAATVHGRFLIREGPVQRLLIGFHGYAETAEVHLEQLERIDGIDSWTVVSVQALHPFYAARTQQVVASWMTRQNRELAIADNIEYVRNVVARFPQSQAIVFEGYSQGTAMAFRAAANIRCDGVITMGADVPPDVIANLPPVFIGRGSRDEWYTAEKFEKDLKFLRSITDVTECRFEGGHEWTDEYRHAAANFLQQVSRSTSRG